MKRTYYLFNPGILSRKDNTLKFTPVKEDENGTTQIEGQIRYLPVETVSDLYVFGSLHANSALYNFLGKNDIAVHFFDYYENYTGSFMPREQLLAGRMILAQVAHHQHKAKRMVLARKFIEGATHNMLVNMKYYNRRGKDMETIIAQMTEYSQLIEHAQAVDQLMGIEGNIRQAYYSAFDLMINDFEMSGRSKQPPQNEVNALVSFGNMMCYSQCLRAIHQTQLNPTISYLHSPGERRYSLALDVAEIFKPVLVDRLIFSVLNKKVIQEKHFDKKLNRCVLNESGKSIFVKAMEEKLQDTLQHPVLKRKVSYKHLMKLECYKLAKHLLDMEEYKPYKAKW